MKIIFVLLVVISSIFSLTQSIEHVTEKSGKYFVVWKPIEVVAGDTLIVPMGSEVLFSSLSGITLSGGTLLAPGTRSSPIFFTSVQDTNNSASAFDWIGLDVQVGAFAKLAFSCIAYSSSGITAAESSSVTLDSCIFTANGQWSLSLNGVVSQVEDKKLFSYYPPVVNNTAPNIEPISSNISKVKSNKFKKVLIGCSVAAAAASVFFFVKSNNIADDYDSYVPGNPDFDNSSTEARQSYFDNQRSSYNVNFVLGLSCLSFSIIDGVYIAYTHFGD